MVIGVVTAKFNSEITLELEKGAIETLKKAGLKDHQIWAVQVPGAVEIPLATKVLFEQGCDGVVTLGAVIRGDTAHFDYVCQSVERGVTQLMLETGKPIGFGVLTTENEEQAIERTTGSHGNKGSEAAIVVLEMLSLLSAIKSKYSAKTKSRNIKKNLVKNNKMNRLNKNKKTQKRKSKA